MMWGDRHLELDLEGSSETVDVVLLPSPAGLPDALTYLLPRSLQRVAAVGMPVLVPLGGREQLGYILAVGPRPPEGEAGRLKPIRSIPRPEAAFDGELLALLRWVAAEYRCPLGEALPLAVPERHSLELQAVLRLGNWDGSVPERTGLLSRQTLEALFAALTERDGAAPRAEIEAAVNRPNFGPVLRRARAEKWVTQEYELLAPRVRQRTLKGVRAVDGGDEPDDRGLGSQQTRLLEALQEGPVRLQRDIQREMGISPDTVQRLQRRGLVEALPVAVRRAPRGYDDGPAAEAPDLNPFQATAAGSIRAAMRRGEGETLLLFGVTGSGKTEVYLHAIQEAREAGRTALLLVPEISLTAQVATAVRGRLGERVAILHSALSDGERFDEWERVRKGEADVVVGPRSALFAPLKAPALVILDEEHDGSYKQDRAPRYHARDTALERARLAGGAVVLGSATPGLESFHAAQAGRYSLLELPERVRQRPLPTVEVVDFRKELKRGSGAVLGARLEEAVRRRLAAGEQVILFLNRRGYSPFLLCRDCGDVPHCPNCDVSLTLHDQDRRELLCHHCAYTLRAPDLCRQCLGHRLRPFGLGTQRVAEGVRELFPTARVARLDRDAVATKDAHTRIIQAVREREVDILIGTQMVTKGFDFPGVTLVGVVAADVALNTPDFRAGERAFQLLTQVSGRPGRGDQPGEVIVQTFKPEHPSIAAAARHDYRGFYQTEIAHREELGYPPFGSLVRFLAQDPSAEAAAARAEAAAAILEPVAARAGGQVKGPVACPLSRLKDRFRWHLLLRAPTREVNRHILDETWPVIRERVGGISVDVEPVDLL
jgi:primosomal protein N' (replication factor Y)